MSRMPTLPAMWNSLFGPNAADAENLASLQRVAGQPLPTTLNGQPVLPIQSGNDQGGVRAGLGPPILPPRGGIGANPIANAAPANAVVTNPGAALSSVTTQNLAPGVAPNAFPNFAPSQEVTSAPTLNIMNGAQTQMFNPEGRQVGGGMVGTANAPFSPTSQTPQGYEPQLALLDAIRQRAMQDTPLVIGGGTMDEFNQQLARRGQAMSGLLNQALPNILNNNLGQGELGLRGMELLGGNGLRGRLQIAGQEADTRAQENERYGPSARYDSFYTQAYGAFPPGTPHDARVRQLQQQGMPPPQFLSGGRQAPGATPNPLIPNPAVQPTGGVRDMYGIPNPAGGGNAPQNVVDTAFENAMSSFPRNPQTGVRQLPTDNPEAIQNAITRVFAAIPDDATLRANFPAIQARLAQEVGGADALDAWINTTNNPLSTRFGTNMPMVERNAQVDRVLRMAGVRRSQGLPFGTGVPFQQSLLSMTPNPGAIAGYGINALR